MRAATWVWLVCGNLSASTKSSKAAIAAAVVPSSIRADADG